MNRRAFLRLGAGLFPLALGRSAASAAPAGALFEGEGEGVPFSQAALLSHARTLAERPYSPPEVVAQRFARMTYDQYRALRFKKERALWAGEGIGVAAVMFSAGYIYNHLIDVFAVEGGIARKIPFDAELFDGWAAKLPVGEGGGLGFSGFRLHGGAELEEFVVFQGASYFRARAKGQTYGLSARGLALNTARPPADEFPVFRAFFIEKPAPASASVTVHALLDSVSVSGAYTFAIRQETATLMDVSATLFPRTALNTAGIAPMTSMFFFAPSFAYKADEVRPRIHDSDGLLIVDGNGEHLFRPLINPPRVAISNFPCDGLKGFGLLQRERRAERYEDLDAFYEARPSLWMEPLAGFGEGSVELVELPTHTEYFDNVVAYFRPKEPLAAGVSHSFRYRLTWCDTPPVPKLPAVRQTLVGASTQHPGMRLIYIDYEGTEGLALCDVKRERCPHDQQNVSLWASAGAILNVDVRRNTIAGGHRVGFEYEPAPGSKEADLRCVLLSGGMPASEVWAYRWMA